MAPFAPGPLIDIAHGSLRVTIAPQAGGRIAQIHYDGIDQLVGYDEANTAMIAWGCYPMLPWAGPHPPWPVRLPGPRVPASA